MSVQQTITKKINVCTGQEVDTQIGGRASGRTTALILGAISYALANGKALLFDHNDYHGYGNHHVAIRLLKDTEIRLDQMGLLGFKLKVVNIKDYDPLTKHNSFGVLLEFSPTREFVYELRK